MLGSAAGLADATHTNYVLLMTDGQPNCGGDANAVAATIAQLYAQTPSVRTFVVGIGDGASSDPNALNSWADAGHTARSGATKYYQVNTAQDLQRVHRHRQRRRVVHLSADDEAGRRVAHRRVHRRRRRAAGCRPTAPPTIRARTRSCSTARAATRSSRARLRRSTSCTAARPARSAAPLSPPTATKPRAQYRARSLRQSQHQRPANPRHRADAGQHPARRRRGAARRAW